eukprot:TRINITY_DN976_c0_g1_i1.p1 TRINITY_DN976_c0_g1~~TRINITY_DN976_c0_g1_i1.p1  ORF type:complete len:107 (-),score=10.25 TRINITY_DN976_c0_g1_i1:122-442(-)
MCKHIRNPQVAIRAPCCGRWFDCAQCHEELTDHPLLRTTELTMMCKKCKKAFRKDLLEFDPETDIYCPYCDNCYDIPAVVPEKKEKLVLELEGAHGSHVMHELPQP